MVSEAIPKRRWPGLPTVEALRELGWPYAGARAALTSAYELLHWSLPNDNDVIRIVEAVFNAEDADGDLRPIEETLLETADEVVRRLNGPNGELCTHLTDAGWVIPEMPRSQFPIQTEHVFAVGALVAGARLLRLQQKASVMLRDLLKPDFNINVPDVREALYSTELVIGCCRLSAEAMFISGRVDMQKHTRSQEAEARRSRAAMGAPRPTFSDDDLVNFCAQWSARHGGRTHGMQKAAAAHFEKTDGAIRKRLEKIRTG